LPSDEDVNTMQCEFPAKVHNDGGRAYFFGK